MSKTKHYNAIHATAVIVALVLPYASEGGRTAVNRPIQSPTATTYNKRVENVYRDKTADELAAIARKNQALSRGIENNPTRRAYLYREAERRGDKTYLEAHKNDKR